ncbi:uncharacterized protein IL334_000089 [Kwoniella shivajii]|uniref:Sister chromatid cohesion protein n=1 Tax=Kwoniella shivajii TaxID=564305 RepID=A0ABZ1CR76_9TREE|nr:hypothetical protein IL334_000089 [Kwoniella shivajii]
MSQPYPVFGQNAGSNSRLTSNPDPNTNGHSQSQSGSGSGSGIYDDPSNLLSVYPFMTYAPTARVAQHLSSHTTTYLPPASSSDLYPQYNSILNRLDNPTTIEDWAMRQAAEARLREVLRDQRSSFAQQLRPLVSEQHGQNHSPTSTDTSNTGPPPPLPLNLLRQYLPSQSSRPLHHNDQLPTPSSTNGGSSPPANVPAFLSDPKEYLDNFVNATLARVDIQAQSAPTPAPVRSQSIPTNQPDSISQAGPSAERGRERRTSMSAMRSPHPPSSVTSTPTHQRIMQSSPISSPDPLGPSPQKRRRRSNKSSSRELSPSLNSTLPSGSTRKSIPDMELSSLTMQEQNSEDTPKAKPVHRKTVEVVIPSRRKVSKDGSVFKSEEEEDDEDELDWGEDNDGDWNMDDRYHSPRENSAIVPKGSKRTGERDTRSSWQKLSNLLEDIFEESDAFPANPSSGDLLGSRFFSLIMQDGTTPLLSYQAIKKVSSYVYRIQVARRRQSSVNGEVEQWDAETMASILRLLERNMRDIESLNVFSEDRKGVSLLQKDDEQKGGKQNRKKKDQKLPNPTDENEDGITLSDDVLQGHEIVLRRARDGVAASECVLVLLDSEGLSKQMYSEDLLTTSVSIVKDQMEKVIFPVIEGLAGEKISSSYLSHIVQAESTSSKKGKSKTLSPYFSHPSLSAIAVSIISAIPRLTSMISKSHLAFSDSLVIQTVYLTIGPLFINEPVSKKGKSNVGVKEAGGVMKGLKMEALGCLRGAFARYEDQRQWIVEEILSSLVRIPEQNHVQNRFELSNGKFIHTISALLLQLIQASAYGTISKIRKIHSSAEEAEMMGVPENKADPHEEEARICTETIENALRSARIVAGYLVQKSTTTKATKTSHDTEYRAILDLFLRDLMVVLYRPEWPASALYLTVFSRILIASLEDQKIGPESTAAKATALDYLGDIAARLKALSLQMSGEGKLATLDEIIANVDMLGLTKLINAQSSIMTFLSSAAREDGSLSSSRDMASIVWVQELQSAIKKSTAVVEKLITEKTEEAQETGQRLQAITTTLKNILRNVWMADDGLFEVHDPRGSEAASFSSIAVSRGRPLQNAIDPILIALLGVMDSPAVGLRSKALRGPQIRQALEERLSDCSPAVRDAAVELVGKYIVQKPALAAEYYHHIALRATDNGLGVRKRVIKLLRGIFSTMDNRGIKIDICCKMIQLIDDQDEGVKDLAVKTLTELLYSSGEDAAGLLVDILGEFKSGDGSIERAMDGVSKECETAHQKKRLGQTIESLISRLIDATEKEDFDSLSHIKAIWLLCGSDPSQIDTQKAGILLSYLGPAANADDQSSNELLLKIFRKCIPHMPRTASTFASDLTKKLMPMISKPAGGFQVLRETIGCFCAVTNHLTRDWTRLITVLRACEAKIRPIRNQYINNGVSSAPNQAAAMMLYITALIAEGCKLDNIALEDAGVDLELRKITSISISEYLYEVYADFSKIASFQNAATICLGSLFRSYPFLLQRKDTTDWMQETFKSPNEDNRAQLLGVIHEFLSSEAEKRASGSKAKKGEKKEMGVDLLRGDAKELQDSDYSTTIVQNNIEQIFECARSQNPPTQNAALDILTFVVNQGLYSPVHTVPILVTLETCDGPRISERALALHSALHQKHASLVTVLFLESAKASYLYQRSITSEPSGHRHGVALFQSWYNLLSEKRAWRNDFLKAMSRVFDRDSMSDINTGFVLYLADNLATLDYRLQEEPMTIVQSLQKIISTCTHLVSMMEETIMEDQPNVPAEGRTIKFGKSETVVKVEHLIDSSIVVGLAVLLKNHLLALYHLPEDKCTAHIPGKKSTVGDKPTQRRGSAVLDLTRLPLVRGVHTVGEFRELQSAFLRLLHEDGSLAE